MECARGHVTTIQSRDLASPIYGHVGASTGYTWPRDLPRDLISLGPDTPVSLGLFSCMRDCYVSDLTSQSIYS